MRKYFILIPLAIISNIAFCQTNRIRNLTQAERDWIQNDDETKRKDQFPPKLATPYPVGTLGHILQTKFQTQANGCGINRSDNRNYIPSTVLSAFGQDQLINTNLTTVNVSSGNLLFLVLNNTEKDRVSSLNEGSFIATRKILGLSSGVPDVYFPKYSEAIIQSPQGFPGFIQKKNCSGYFEGNLAANIKAPIAELTASLQADANYSSSMILISAQYVSPLKGILQSSGPESIYTHLLLWQMYHDDYVNNSQRSSIDDLLINRAYYISEFKGISIGRTVGFQQDFAAAAKINAGVSAGIFSANGNISAGTSSSSSFSLKDFSTGIFNTNDQPNYIVSRLPTFNEISQKLQGAKSSVGNPFKNLASSAIPFTIYRVLNGIPTDLCGNSSWDISNWDQSQWMAKPTVISSIYLTPGLQYPQCVCQITGNIKPEAIKNAINSTIVFKYDLVNSLAIGENKLSITITEPPVAITNSPFFNYNDYAINALRKTTSDQTGKSYSWKLEGQIYDDGVPILTPTQISNVQITFNDPTQSGLVSIPVDPVPQGKNLSFEIVSQKFGNNLVETENEISISITVTFKVKLAATGNPSTSLTTKVITLKVPELKQN